MQTNMNIPTSLSLSVCVCKEREEPKREMHPTPCSLFFFLLAWPGRKPSHNCAKALHLCNCRAITGCRDLELGKAKQPRAAQAALALLHCLQLITSQLLGYGCLSHSLTGPAMHDTWDKGCVPSFGLVKRLLLHAIVESAFLPTCHCCSNASSCLYIQPAQLLARFHISASHASPVPCLVLVLFC